MQVKYPCRVSPEVIFVQAQLFEGDQLRDLMGVGRDPTFRGT